MAELKIYILYVLQYSMVVISTVGIILNILTYLVFQRKRFKKTSFSFYFKALIISDILMLVFNYRVFLNILYKISLDNMNQFLCKFLEYTGYIIGSVNVWIVSLILFDRLVSIVFLQRLSFIKTRMFHFGSVLAVITVSALIYIPMPYFREFLAPNQESNQSNNSLICWYPGDSSLITYWLDMANMLLGCLLSNNILAIITMFHIYRSRKRCQRLDKSVAKDIKFAINTIVLNIVIFLLQTPVSIILIIVEYLKDELIVEILFSFGVLLIAIKCSTALLVNLTSNSIFYSEFLKIFA